MSLKVAHSSPAALAARTQVASVGTTRGDARFEEGAVIPIGPWRSLDHDVIDRLRPGRSTADDIVVEVVGAESIGPDHLNSPGTHMLGKALSVAKSPTTTPNYQDGRLIGLHVDNWDKLSHARKHTGRRRLCINLGPGTRYILLGDVDIQNVCRTVREDHAACYPHTDDLRSYVARGFPLHCLRIRLDPGEGYIAPTEFLPHDGSTEDQQESTAAFWLGRWACGAMGSLV
ncbi:hypothetical protein [Kitasatospora sp. MY 5-36]|uniref:hypothetical protein n=2 Tax=unclassified Kitasatospora TaxID=2633591 RepID=UPI0006713EB5|nr:hypothetical protein [Kitasatospora sp. MY 5-36]